MSGERFARWRWVAPPTTNIRSIRGNWWHVLDDGFQERLGGATVAGDFSPALIAGSTSLTPSAFDTTFTPSVPAVEDRLLCARGDDKFCSLDPESWSAMREVVLTVDDGVPPGSWITGGSLTDGGWRRGSQFVAFSGFDAGSGVDFGETTLDGARLGVDQYPCSTATVAGTMMGMQMRPCLTDVSGTQPVDTTHFSDGPHTLGSCEQDFAGVRACASPLTVLIDNNAPAAPTNLRVEGGEGWHGANDFSLTWLDPDQGVASPVEIAYLRIRGPGEFDSERRNFVVGKGVAKADHLHLPGEGQWEVWVWLRDAAGNEDPTRLATAFLRFDAQPPTIAFEGTEGDEDRPPPAQIVAAVADGLSGAAGGTISYRRAESQEFVDLPTKLHRDDQGKTTLVAPTPDLAPGTWVFRAEASDGAGNKASTSLRGDGTQMAFHVKPPDTPGGGDQGAGGQPGDGNGDGGRNGAGGVRRRHGHGRGVRGRGARGGKGRHGAAGSRGEKTRLFVRLRGGHGKGEALTVPFGGTALLAGKLTDADGAGLAGKRVRVVSRPSHGALVPRSVEHLTTGKRGSFVLRLPAGTSRRISVSFAGAADLAPAAHRSLDLRVRSGVTLAASPATLETGEEVQLTGRVRSRGAPIPRRGKLVAIQYLEAQTGRWRPVLVTRTDHDGRFHARYRFRYIKGAARIRLRAMALAEERWPYGPGSSLPVTVAVQGN